MTLIVNEIMYFPGNPGRSLIVAAADSQITENGAPRAPQRKIFQIESLNATVSYFGMVDVNMKESFEDLLARFVISHGTNDIRTFAHALRSEIDMRVDKSRLATRASGLHVCGFNGKGVPEFWFIRNIRGMEGVSYRGFERTYTISEELAEVHQKDNYDAEQHDFRNAFGFSFRNGDLRPLVAAWDLFDEFTKRMVTEGLVDGTTTREGFKNRVEWKMHAIASFYETVAMEHLIGEPITTYMLTP